MDAQLRLDPGIELIRTSGGLEALSELAEPSGASPASREPAVVIIGTGTELDSGADAGDRLADFAEAVRRIDPGVLLMHVEEIAPPSRAGISPVPPLGNSGRLFDPISPRETELPDAPPAAASGSEHDIADQELVESLMAGRPLQDLAIELLRRRTGFEAIRFEETASEATDHDLVEPVVFHGRSLGRIIVPGREAQAVDRAVLREHAAWLAAWLALAEQHTRLRVEAFTDPVTGAWNRRYFDRFIRSSVEHARRHRHRLTLLMFDIDDFKSFNDDFGHAAGDEILGETVQLLKSVIRPTDRVCRIGGDEFAVVFYEPEGPRSPNSEHPTSVFEVAERFQSQINQQRFPKLGLSAPGSLTVSGGLATFPWDGATAEELIRRADELSMESKQQGKNAITLGPGAERVKRDG